MIRVLLLILLLGSCNLVAPRRHGPALPAKASAALASPFTETWMGHTTGYIYFGFNGSGPPSSPTGAGPNIFTTAFSSDGLTWTNLGGNWLNYKSAGGYVQQINAPDCLTISSTWYCHVATANDFSINLVPWIFAQGDSTTGVMTTLASIDWTSKISGVFVCFAGGFARNSDGTVFTDGDGVHLFVPCSITNNSSFKVYETHAATNALTTWSDPVDTGLNQSNTYDPQVYKVGSTFWMWNKDGTGNFVTLASSSAIAGTYTMSKTGDWAGWGAGLEGPFMYRPANDVGWILMFEAFATSHLMYYSTCSTDDPTACTWAAKALWTQDMFMRHGAVVKLQ